MAETAIEKDATLTEAIKAAVETQDKSDVVIESKEEEKSEEAKTEEHETAADEEAEQGKVLIQALKDPARSAAVIDFIATQAGYTKQTVQTKADVKEAKEDILGILERNLGEEFKFLAPKLAPAIKESLDSILAQNNPTNELKARIEKQELKEIQTETAETHAAIAQEWFGSDDMPANVIQAMSRAMDDFPPTDPNMAPSTYYRKIFNFVVGDLGLTRKGKSDRVSRNQSDSVARNLTAQNRGVTPENTSGGPRKMSLKDAVSLAVEQVDQSSRK